jgi:Uri superfamily endonuclease
LPLPASTFPPEPGTYALVLACCSHESISVGKLGVLCLHPGFYVYVGSAFGPGGLAARLRHHVGIAQRPHWHVDTLRARCEFIAVWFTTDPRRREHTWARKIARLPGAQAPFPGFGSSDCACLTHLFWFRSQPRCPFAGAGAALKATGSSVRRNPG